MSINTYQVRKPYEDEQASVRQIANDLTAGERVFIEPVGEVFMHLREDGVPQLDFVLSNQFISGVVELHIEKLTNYNDALKAQK